MMEFLQNIVKDEDESDSDCLVWRAISQEGNDFSTGAGNPPSSSSTATSENLVGGAKERRAIRGRKTTY